MNIYFDLFLTFAKIGLFTFGGGYSMLPMLEREVVKKKEWATSEELLDYYAIAQCTPGVIAVNTATFVGNKKKGWLGGALTTLGVVFPSLIIIIIIAALLSGFADNAYVQNALKGVRIAVCALVTVSIFKMAKKGIVDFIGIIIFVLAFLSTAIIGLSPVVVILAAALVGIIVSAIKGKRGRSGEK